jgi:hypothetical protein
MKSASLWSLLALATSGCLGTIDAVIYVQGKITDEQQMLYDRCSIFLRDQKGKIFVDIALRRRLRHYESNASMQEPNEGANFLTLSSLPPWTSAASVSVSCVGSDQIVERKITGGGGTRDNPVDLGSIVLTRRQ